MAYRLRDNLGACVAGGRAVFLDLDADRYFGLPAAADKAFQQWLTGQDPEPEQLDVLVSRGLLLLCGQGSTPPSRASFSLPAAGRETRPKGRVTAIRFVHIFLARLYWSFALKLRSLAAIRRVLEAKRPKRESSAGPHDPRYDDIATSFEKTEAIMRTHDRCLSDSLAFLSICYASGLSPRLVFGVRTTPFAAHCWVQVDDLVLNDRLEHVRLFTPILVI